MIINAQIARARMINYGFNEIFNEKIEKAIKNNKNFVVFSDSYFGDLSSSLNKSLLNDAISLLEKNGYSVDWYYLDDNNNYEVIVKF